MNRPGPTIQAISLLAACLVALLAAGCGGASKRSPLMKQAPNVAVAAPQLRVAVNVFAERFSNRVEQTADQIIAGTDEPQIRTAAIQWKLAAILACQRAAFQSDSLAALLDVWALCAQQRQYFVEGAGKNQFAELQYLAADVSTDLEKEVVELARSITVTGDVSLAEQQVAEFVEKNPIESPAFMRPSARTLAAEAMGARSPGALAAVSSLNESVNDLSDRSTVYAEYLPKQILWQTQLLMEEYVSRDEVDVLIADVHRLDDSLHRVAVGVEEIPQGIEEEIVAKLPAATDEIERFVDEQRVLALRAITAERVAVLDYVTKERQAVLDAVATEREIVLAAIHNERLETVVQLDEIVHHKLVGSFDRLDALVDKIFWRATLLLGGLVAALAVFGFVALRTLRPSGS